MPTTVPQLTSTLLIEPKETLAQHFRDLLATAFPQLPYSQLAQSLHQALSILRNRRIPIVFIDLDLPDSTGPDAIRAIRAASPSSAMIAFTETGRLDALLEAVPAGAHEILHNVLPSQENLVLAIKTALVRVSPLDTQTEVSQSSCPVGLPFPSLPKLTHDLNNALTSINGFTDVLLVRLPTEDAPYRCAEQIKEACDRAALLVRDLSRLSPSAPSDDHRTLPTQPH